MKIIALVLFIIGLIIFFRNKKPKTHNRFLGIPAVKAEEWEENLW